MRRADFEHIIAAAAQVAQEDELVVIGSQAILGSYPDAPATLLRSLEADIFPANAPEKADLIDGALGDGSPFIARSATTPTASVPIRPLHPRVGAIVWCGSTSLRA